MKFEVASVSRLKFSAPGIVNVKARTHEVLCDSIVVENGFKRISLWEAQISLVIFTKPER